MGVDFDAYLIYGFQLDNIELQKFLDERYNNCYNFYEWIESVEDETLCEFLWEDHYRNPLDNNIYFGIRIYNRATADTIREIIDIRTEEICDDLIRIFGSYNIVDESIVPKIFAVPVVH